jgi:hypothetical protein
MQRWFWAAAAAAALSTGARVSADRPKVPVPSSYAGVRIKTAVIVPKPCPYPDSPNADGTFGNVLIELQDGRKITLTQCLGRRTDRFASSPQVSPDGRTVGWLEGPFLKTNTSYYFYGPEHLVLWRDGRELRRLKGDKRHYTWEWFFWNKGTQVAMQTRGSHGIAVNELRSVETGKLITSIEGPKIDRKSPEWARRLGD